MPASLRTERLVVRALSLSDVEQAFALWCVVGAPLPVATPQDVAATRAVMVSILGLYAAFGHGPFGVCQAGGALIGDSGLFSVASAPRERELSYRLHPDARGHGYATEAAKGLVQTAWTSGVEAVVADVDVANTASQGVARRAGMHLIGREGSHLRYRIVSSEAPGATAPRGRPSSRRG